MIRNISIGIDLGSTKTKVVVGEFLKGEKNPKIIGVGESETKGTRHGYVVNQSDAVNSVKNAVAIAEKNSGIKIKRAFISINGTTLCSETSSGEAIISKANSEVTNLDIKKALEDCENNLNLNNKKVIQSFPLSFKLDGKEVLGQIEGMHGNKLEIKGFRGNDYAIVRSINKLANETLIIQTKANRIVKVKEEEETQDKEEIVTEELTDKQLHELIQLKNKIEDINEKTQPFIEKLGQRGIKRAENPEIKSIDKLDKIPNRELDYPFLRLVYNIMSELSTPTKTVEAEEKKSNTEP